MSESQSHPGLYIHVPFCLSKCPYCDFNSITALDLIPAWLGALEEECRLRAGTFEAFDSLYVGGGTPSVLGDGHIDRLTAALYRYFQFEDHSEITIEVNPDDVCVERLELLRSLGFNRISLGIQSMQGSELRFLGRRHTAEQTLHALDEVRSAGFDRMSLDLIYGFSADPMVPHRILWESTLEKVLRFEPDHLSCYMLTIEGDTPFKRLFSEGKPALPSEEEGEELFVFTSEFLEEHGFLHYEISNFARSPASFCRHNRKYWDHTPYLGLGPSAHSFRERKRWWNKPSVHQYCESLQAGTLPMGGSEDLTEEQLQLEGLFLGLRTRWGVDESLLVQRSGASSVLPDLLAAGILERRGNRIVPTRKGFLLADGLPLLF
jgi:oxygen-independent coproporphyrinogen-3 oxidase